MLSDPTTLFPLSVIGQSKPPPLFWKKPRLAPLSITMLPLLPTVADVDSIASNPEAASSVFDDRPEFLIVALTKVN